MAIALFAYPRATILVSPVFKPVELARVDIFVLKTHVSRVTWALARLRLIHLVDVHASAPRDRMAAGDSAHSDQAERRFAEVVDRARRLMESLALGYDPLALDVEVVSDEEASVALERQLENYERTLTELADRCRNLEKTSAQTSRQAKFLRLMAAARIDISELGKSGRLAIKGGILPAEEAAILQNKLSAIPNLFQRIGEIDGATAIVVATLASESERMDEALREERFEEMAIPSRRISDAALEANRRNAEIAAELQTVRETLRRAAAQASQSIAAIRRKAEIGGGLIRASRSFAAVGHTIVISGWAPKDRLDEVRRVVRQEAAGAAYVEVADPSELRRAGRRFSMIPVLFNNPLLLKPFEKITAAYGIPQYREVEPTAFLAVSFLIMFGVMFGDAGQGAVLAIIGYTLFRTSYRYTDIGVLLVECGVASAIFGLLYGSVFGSERLIRPIWFNPMRNVSTSIEVALFFGATLISVGLVLNIVNGLRAGDISAAIFGERGLMGAFMYWVCLAIATKYLLTGRAGLAGTALSLLLGIPAITILLRRPVEEIFRRRRAQQPPPWKRAPAIFLESLMELFDAFLSYLANTVSFIRLAAFSLAHIGLFAAVFALADSLSRLSGGGIFYWLMLIAGNIAIIVLEGMVASIQAIRLEYYEIFSKFFKGGGEAFRPLEV